ncbi:MAG: thermonuclease family protein [Rhodopseudomonas sp.]|uniref:thermonuclease family protein n=1 Tax=Rhodopseudomonas sp. TaxID=1078 RepID=UPI0017A3BBFA|nr:thermonuclease family protein [Rhodopseudomonas sp.]NVN85758.1 thermonuclease family protein [Rhodopseudomonas sp.]
MAVTSWVIAAITNRATAAGCSFAPQGEGRVAAVLDSRSFRMQDGREVKLAGIEPATTPRDGIAALAEIVAGQEVTLRGDSDAPDRYGRQLAFVLAGSEERSVQGQLLSRGQALVAADVAAADCRTELLAAEARARLEKQGIWADSTVIKNAENPGDILSRMGQFTLVEGRVVSVRQAGATVYLNFGRRWTRDFTVTISRRMLASFEAQGVNPKSLEGKRIRVRGWIEGRGGPRIEVRQVGQIELAGGT